MSGHPLLSMCREGGDHHPAQRRSHLWDVRDGGERRDADAEGATVGAMSDKSDVDAANLYREVFYDWVRETYPEIVEEFELLQELDEEKPMN